MKNKYNEYGYEVARIKNTLEIKLRGDREFTDEEAIEALEWLVFELRLQLREEEMSSK